MVSNTYTNTTALPAPNPLYHQSLHVCPSIGLIMALCAHSPIGTPSNITSTTLSSALSSLLASSPGSISLGTISHEYFDNLLLPPQANWKLMEHLRI